MTDRPHMKLPDEIPPVFGSWRRLYVIVLAELVIIVVLSFVLTEVYR